MKSSAFSLRRTLGAVTSASLCLANGRADISDFTSVGTIEAEAQVAIRPDNDHFDPNPARDDDRPPDEFDVASFNKSARADATKAGLRAKGRAQEQAQVSFDAHNFSFSASGTTEATASRTGDPLKDNNTGAGGSIGFAVRFRIDSKSRFALGGNVSVQTNGSTGSSEAQVVLEGRTDDGKEVKFDFDAEDDPGDPRTISISKSGELEPGSYSVSVFALSTIGSDQPTSRCSMNASFTLFSPTPAPDTGEEIRWTNAASGRYFDPANWRPQRVPVKTAERSDTAIFGLATSYDVTLSDPAGPTFTLGAGAGSCERCLVTSGSVLDLGGGSLTVFGTSLVDPSFVVTRDAKLNLTGGTLSTRNALLGKDANRLGEAHVFNTGTRWENNGRMTIGERGEGKLFIANGGFVTALETILGADSAQGSAIVGGDGSQWETGNLVVGSTSRGNLTIEAGGAVNSGDVVISGRRHRRGE